MAKLIGLRALLTVQKGLQVDVVVLDGRSNYGHNEIQVEPKEGVGKVWLRLDRIELNPPTRL